jgi:hypothetical protein
VISVIATLLSDEGRILIPADARAQVSSATSATSPEAASVLEFRAQRTNADGIPSIVV